MRQPDDQGRGPRGTRTWPRLRQAARPGRSRRGHGELRRAATRGHAEDPAEIRQEIRELRFAGASLAAVTDQLSTAGALVDQALAAVRDRRRGLALHTVDELAQVLAHAGAHTGEAALTLDEDAVCPCCQVTALVEEIIAAVVASAEDGRYVATLPEFYDGVRARAAATGADLRWLPATVGECRALLFTAAVAVEEHAITVVYHPGIDGVEFRRFGSDDELPAGDDAGRAAAARLADDRAPAA